MAQIKNEAAYRVALQRIDELLSLVKPSKRSHRQRTLLNGRKTGNHLEEQKNVRIFVA